MSASTARARIKTEITKEITATAHQQIAQHGPGGLSLRAIARELGMASSGIYRYFKNRDELITALIIDAYERLGHTTEKATTAPHDNDLQRWTHTCSTIHKWALRHPHEYTLIYGTPIPGYLAPIDTIDAASRMPLALANIVVEAANNNRLNPPEKHTDTRPLDIAIYEQFNTLSTTTCNDLVIAWSNLTGLISSEIGGHFHNVVHDIDAFFHYAVKSSASRLGLTDMPYINDQSDAPRQ